VGVGRGGGGREEVGEG
jgi:hypothetical protein